MPKMYDVLELTVSGTGQYLVSGQFFPVDTKQDDARVEAATATLAPATHTNDSIGVRLTDFLFGQNLRILELFELAMRAVRQSGDPLRLRLVIGSSAGELQQLPWELLDHPQMSGPLLLDERILFSRYMFADDWAPSSPRPPVDPSAAVLLADPKDLKAYGSEENPPAKVRPELATIATDALTNWRFDAPKTAATLDNIVEALRAKPDVMYLVCHGLSTRSGSILLLERADGMAEEVSTIELVEKMREVGHLPRLFVLGSCSSAGEGEAATVRTELAPLLCREGVPAVVAMRGSVTQDTSKEFLETFFRGIQDHGQLDLAMATARRGVRNNDDWSVPTLFMRFRSGRLFARATPDVNFDKWPALLTAIAKGECVPVIGPGASEWLCGSRNDMAYRLARDGDFPLALPQRSELPQVSQFLAVHQSADVLGNEVRRKLWEGIRSRFPQHVEHAPADEELENTRLIDDMLHSVAQAERWSQDHAEPHLVLAELPFPLYLSTEPFDLTARALERTNRTPVVRAHYRWREKDDFEQLIKWPDDEMNASSDEGSDELERPALVLDSDRPIVYQLFGSLQAPNSVTLTEDEYFEWMFGYGSESSPPLHPFVQTALTWQTLLFIGFRIDDWDLRVLLRTIQRFAGGSARKKVPHLAVQIDPDEDRAVKPDRARRYLKELLDVAQVTVYWGSTETFCRELQKAHREIAQ